MAQVRQVWYNYGKADKVMAQELLNDRYELLDRLGEGGMAVVYRARDALLDRIVAIKVLREQLTSDPVFLERFRREAQAAARLSHPNIVGVYDVGQAGGQHYIVMEYVAGSNLKSLLIGKTTLSIAQSLAIAEQVCAALDHAHQQGFVHRDIKPQNILVARETGRAAASGPLVKVADFGLARSLSSVTSSTGDLVFGTVQYTSPEQAQGQPATPASDIYAVGVVLFEMLTGRLPFESDTPLGVALKHIQESPVPPSRLNPRLPPSVDGFVLRALAKDPAQRFASAAEMGATLAAYRQFTEEGTGSFQPVQPVAVARQAQPQAAAPQPVSVSRPARPGTSLPAARPQAPPPVPVHPAARQAGRVDWLLLALLLITFVAIAGLVPLAYAVRAAVFPPTPTPVPQVRVPALVGLEQAVADSQLQALGLTLVIQDARFDEQVAAQRIIAQLVPAGTLLPVGQPVDVIVSRGRETVRVPPVSGLTLNEAELRLGATGLRVERRDSPSNQVPSGVVMAQEPAAETEVERNSTVRLTVSVGDRVVVPNLFGKAETEAQRLIRDAGLTPTFPNPQGPEDVPEANRWVFTQVGVGAVISQMPEAGALVERGAIIQIAIRKK